MKTGGEKVEAVIGNVDDLGPAPAANPERASDSLDRVQFAEPDEPQGKGKEPPKVEVKPRRKLKSELEQENAALREEIGRRDQAAASNAPELVESMVSPLALSFGISFGVVASMRGKHWALTEEEKISLGRIWAPCLAPMLANHPELVMWSVAIGGSAVILGPRLREDAKLAEERKAEKGDKAE